jgi:hypothetical protein
MKMGDRKLHQIQPESKAGAKAQKPMDVRMKNLDFT